MTERKIHLTVYGSLRGRVVAGLSWNISKPKWPPACGKEEGRVNTIASFIIGTNLFTTKLSF